MPPALTFSFHALACYSVPALTVLVKDQPVGANLQDWVSLCVVFLSIVLHLEPMFVGKLGESIDQVLPGRNVSFWDALPPALSHKGWPCLFDAASKVVVVQILVSKHFGHTL